MTFGRQVPEGSHSRIIYFIIIAGLLAIRVMSGGDGSIRTDSNTPPDVGLLLVPPLDPKPSPR